MGDVSDTRWSEILHAQAGDAGALDALVAKYRPAVIRFLERRGAGADAEDLAQEVFVRLIFKGALARVSPDKGRFRSLVLAVSRHALRHHRDYVNAAKRGGGQVVPLPELELAEPGASEEAFDREWVKALVHQALAALELERPRYRRAIDGFVFAGRSQDQVAEELGVTRQDVKNFVRRGRARLADLIRAEIRSYCATPEEYAEELAALSSYLPPE